MVLKCYKDILRRLEYIECVECVEKTRNRAYMHASGTRGRGAAGARDRGTTNDQVITGRARERGTITENRLGNRNKYKDR